MFQSFREYWDSRKPVLDEAFRRQVSLLLGGVRLRDHVRLRDTLEAGKKLRGCLTCLMSEALGGGTEAALPRAVAVELIQAATLIHDDFVDGDRLRRNQPAAWTVEGARRAVLIGDVIFAAAIEMMSRLSREDGLAVSRAIARVSEGALHEPLEPLSLAARLENRDWAAGLYERIIHLKTGILFGTACSLGAIAAGSNGEVQGRAYRYGVRLGEAYQVADDRMDLMEILAAGSAAPERVAVLAPGLFYFVREMRSWLLVRLRGDHADLGPEGASNLRSAAGRMAEEIEIRLQAAAGEAAHFPANEFSDLLRNCPRDLIRMLGQVQ